MFVRRSIPITKTLPPLCVSHRDGIRAPLELAGRVLKLEWREKNLWAEVAVEDKHKDVKGFSVGCQLKEFETVRAFENSYSKVLLAELTELSITNNMANLEALVVSREPYVATGQDDGMAAYLARKAARDVQMAFWLNELRGGQ
ncbi:hypothetical protein [Mesorhizobium sp. M7D.F.Ca.US.004.01.2.1]|nr:hypothetical protein [Mesorhizobium sp. M7D.F.Ca.US.004.01.2.1]RUX97436.1 hypothetical protein EN993_03805 [Mesorhizobium sp. M7D.F.Ca.US.004.01.2.1]